jgi:phosphomannomutase
VVISASHNPFYDNGIKFFSAEGTKLPDSWEEDVEAALKEDPVWVDSASLGKARRWPMPPAAISSSAKALSITACRCAA